MIRYLTGDIMKYVKNIFLILVFALSATAFSTSAMAASGPTDSSAHDTSKQLGLPPVPTGQRIYQNHGTFIKCVWGISRYVLNYQQHIYLYHKALDSIPIKIPAQATASISRWSELSKEVQFINYC
ncbi:hypothetical protein YC94_001530 [Salmonella enterica subsp. diarizonae]|nr:hypothetical protein [Salmonella enterica subsp. diarizonae]